MKRLNWQLILGTSLIFLSAFLYFIHYLIFKDLHHIFIYLLGDIAFVPIEVLLVTLIIHELLNVRERRNLLSKLNMVIGAFFSEVGTNLLQYLLPLDNNLPQLRKHFLLKIDWKEKHFAQAKREMRKHSFTIKSKLRDLVNLKKFLSEKRDFLLRLLENPNLLEHESFTELLWAVFHLTEELEARKSLKKQLPSDHEHLDNDIKRVYRLLILEWIDYMKHLSQKYPYLYSLALRTNPFDPQASPEVKD